MLLEVKEIPGVLPVIKGAQSPLWRSHTLVLQVVKTLHNTKETYATELMRRHAQAISHCKEISNYNGSLTK